jgi:hypothetical protein
MGVELDFIKALEEQNLQLQLNVRVVDSLGTFNITFINNFFYSFLGKHKVTSRNLAGVTRALAWVKLGGVYLHHTVLCVYCTVLQC